MSKVMNTHLNPWMFLRNAVKQSQRLYLLCRGLSLKCKILWYWIHVTHFSAFVQIFQFKPSYLILCWKQRLRLVVAILHFPNVSLRVLVENFVHLLSFSVHSSLKFTFTQICVLVHSVTSLGLPLSFHLLRVESLSVLSSGSALHYSHDLLWNLNLDHSTW